MTSRQPRQGRQASDELRLRLFVAVELPEVWLAALERLQNEMRDKLAQEPKTQGVRLRWVRPEGIHLTLKFLGEVPTGRLESIDAALARAVPSAPALRLELGQVGSFSDRRAPRVVWAGLNGDTKALAELAGRVETGLAAGGFPRERRAFTPHLTLARLPEDLSQQREQLAAITNAFSVPDVPSFVVDRVSLIRSHLGPGGARYQRLAAFPGEAMNLQSDASTL